MLNLVRPSLCLLIWGRSILIPFSWGEIDILTVKSRNIVSNSSNLKCNLVERRKGRKSKPISNSQVRNQWTRINICFRQGFRSWIHNWKGLASSRITSLVMVGIDRITNVHTAIFFAPCTAELELDLEWELSISQRGRSRGRKDPKQAIRGGRSTRNIWIAANARKSKAQPSALIENAPLLIEFIPFFLWPPIVSCNWSRLLAWTALYSAWITQGEIAACNWWG